VCVGVWRRSSAAVTSEGSNVRALFRECDTALAITTTRNVLNILRLQMGAPMLGNTGASAASVSSVPRAPQMQGAELCSFRDAPWQDETTLSAPIFHAAHMQLQSRIKLANDEITWSVAQ
jgi:hypothetical protein